MKQAWQLETKLRQLNTPQQSSGGHDFSPNTAKVAPRHKASRHGEAVFGAEPSSVHGISCPASNKHHGMEKPCSGQNLAPYTAKAALHQKSDTAGDAMFWANLAQKSASACPVHGI